MNRQTFDKSDSPGGVRPRMEHISTFWCGMPIMGLILIKIGFRRQVASLTYVHILATRYPSVDVHCYVRI